jgi:hypothetical protein
MKSGPDAARNLCVSFGFRMLTKKEIDTNEERRSLVDMRTQQLLIRNQNEREEAIARIADARWHLIDEEPSINHRDSTILTFEEKDDGATRQ